MDKICDIELAKLLKEKGFSKETHYYWLSKDLPFVERGLKSCKNDDTMNHNNYDSFIYSAPIMKEAFEFLIGLNPRFEESITIKKK